MQISAGGVPGALTGTIPDTGTFEVQNDKVVTKMLDMEVSALTASTG